MAFQHKMSNEDIKELLQEAIIAGDEAVNAIWVFHKKFMKASAEAGMLTEIRAPFDHICQGK